jgi:hypothetical protein
MFRYHLSGLLLVNPYLLMDLLCAFWTVRFSKDGKVIRGTISKWFKLDMWTPSPIIEK